MYMIVDCNNFYVSCERVFNPSLNHQPVVVLSNNDGCIIARSNEAKALGIKMGQPYFEVSALCNKNKVKVFSSNYALYGDMSNRVMSLIEGQWDKVEVYSIDEAFLDLSETSSQTIERFSLKLAKLIQKCTGIPVSIGVGPTKTLAKCANYIAKRKLQTPFFDITDQMKWLSRVDVSEVWGVGRRWAKRLNGSAIYTAADLKALPVDQIKKQYNVTLARTVLELQGQECFLLEEPKARKSIVSSRSFAKMQTDFAALSGALSSYCDLASAKLRQQKSVVARISVFLTTNPFSSIEKQFRSHRSITLLTPTEDTRVITACAKECLRVLFKPGVCYKKVGVCLEDLRENKNVQLSLLQEHSFIDVEQSKKVMKVYDQINARYGSNTIKLAANQVNETNSMRSFYRSPRYTTSWSELLEVR